MTQREWWFGAACVALAVGLRAVHLNWGLPEVFEEATPVREAIGFWGAAGSGLDLNPHFFKYPSLTFYMQFGLQAVWYFWLSLSGAVSSLNEYRQLLSDDMQTAVLLGRWLQAILGALVVVPAMVLARRLGGVGAGRLAGVLTAVLPVLVAESQLVSPDMALTLFTTAGVASAAAIAGRGNRSDYLWCGLWIGLAASAKYPGALLVVALLVAHALRTREQGHGPGAILFSILPWQAAFTAALAFLLTSPFVLLDAPTAWADFSFERSHMSVGHLGREEGRAWAYYFRGMPGAWTLPVAVLAGVGMLLSLGDPATRRRVLPGVVFAGLMLLILGSWTMAATRYALPLAPLAAALAAVALVKLSARLRSYRVPVLLGAGVLLAAVPLAASWSQVSQQGRPDTRRAAADWIEANVPDGSAILVERYGPEPDAERFKVLYLPFHGVTPHIYDAAYSPPLYATFDYIVLSSGVSARYAASPREYPAQNTFYLGLKRGFDEVTEFSTGAYAGPRIRILKRRANGTLKNLADIPATFFATFKGNRPLAEFLSALGTVLVRQEEPKLGFRMLEEAVEMDGENAKVWGNLGGMRLHEGKVEEALTAFRRAESLAPEDADVRFNLGVIFSRMGEPRQAAEAYREAIRLRPELEMAYVALARSLVEYDRYAEARVVLREFLLRFPRSSRRGQAEEALDQLARMGPGRP